MRAWLDDGGPIVAGLVVWLLLFPASGIDPLPPRCFSVLGFEVPCAAWVSAAAGVATALAVGVALRLVRRRRTA